MAWFTTTRLVDERALQPCSSLVAVTLEFWFLPLIITFLSCSSQSSKEYYDNGNIYSEGQMINGVREGNWILYIYPPAAGDMNPGTSGDMFGGVNALFSALAFAFLIYTALMQREELKMQREELAMTREELKKSADAHRELVKINQDVLDINRKEYLHQAVPAVTLTGFKDVIGDKMHLEFRVLNLPLMLENVSIDNTFISYECVRQYVNPKTTFVVKIGAGYLDAIRSKCKLEMRFLDTSGRLISQIIERNGKYTTHMDQTFPMNSLYEGE